MTLQNENKTKSHAVDREIPTEPDTTGENAAQFLFHILNQDSPLKIVDVGANPVNEPPYAAMLKDGRCEVYGFEPHPAAYDQLIAEKGPNEHYFNLAVGDGTQQQLYIIKPSGLTSTVPLEPKGFHYLGHWLGALDNITTVPVDTVRLDDVDELPDIDVLKIDIQGGEKLVFENARKKLANAAVVITEVRHSQLYKDEPMFGGLDLELRAQGLIFHKFMDNKPVVLNSSQFERLKVGGNRNQLVDGDAAYICNLLDPDSLSTAQIKSLAMAGHDIVRSYDLVARCLDLLVARDEVGETAPAQYVDHLPQHFRRDV